MSDNTEDLKIRITTEAAGNGAAETARGLSDVGSAAKNASNATKQGEEGAKGFGEQLAGLGSKSNIAREALEGISQASEGGVRGFFGLAKAFRSVFEAVSVASPFGLITTGLALAAGAATFLAERLKGPEKSAEELAKDLDDAKQKAQQLGAASMRQLDESLKHVGERAAEDKKKFDDLLASKERVENAAQADQLAKVRNDPALTDEQKVTEQAKIRAKFEDLADQRKIESKKDEVDAANKAVEQTKQAGEAAEVNFKNASDEFDELSRRQSEVAEAKRRLEKIDLDKAISTGLPGSPSAGAGSGPLSEAQIRSRQEEAKLRKIVASNPNIDDEVNKSRIRLVGDDFKGGALAPVDKAREAVFQAQKKADEASASLRLEQQTQAEIRKHRISEETSDLTPAIVEARKKDKEKAAQDKAEITHPENEKLISDRDVLASQQSSIADTIRRSFLPSSSPEIQTLKQQQDQLGLKIAGLEQQISANNAKPRTVETDAIANAKAAKTAAQVFNGNKPDAVGTAANKVTSGGLRRKSSIELSGDPNNGAPLDLKGIDRPDSSADAADAIDKGAAAVKNVKASISKPIAPDALAAPIVELGHALAEVNAGNLSAIKQVIEATQRIAQEQKQQAQKLQQLTDQVANSRQ